MSVTQDYKIVTFSREEFLVLLNALDARVDRAKEFIPFDDERGYWEAELKKAMELRCKIRADIGGLV